MKAKDIATIITGTIAKPSSPSVRFTALADPIIINMKLENKIFQNL